MNLDPRPLLPLASLLLAAAPLAGQVLVVDDTDPGADFSTIEGAVAAAAEGDVIVVRDGTYSAFVTIADKALTLIEDAGHSVTLFGQIKVEGLTAGKQVIVRGIDVRADDSPFGGPAPIEVESCAGTVWIEDGFFPGFSLSNIAPQSIRVANSSRVVIVRANAYGSSGLSGDGGPALTIDNAAVFLYDSELLGGLGGGDILSSKTGGPAAALGTGGFLYSAGSTLRGGTGGQGGSIFGCFESGAGGPGLLLTDASAAADLIDTQTLGGDPGPSDPGMSCPLGPTGPAREIVAGVVQDLTPDLPHGFTATSPASAGLPFTMTAAATPGELAWVAYSTAPNVLYLPNFLGPTLLQQPASVVFAGLIPAGGTLDLPATIQLPPGVLAQRIALQSVFLAPAVGRIFFAAPTHVTVLAPGL